MIFVHRATCSGASSCIICLSPTRSHWLGWLSPVSLSLIPMSSFTVCWCFLISSSISLIGTLYGPSPYSVPIKEIEDEIKKHQQTVKELIGIKESDTGLSQPSQWDLVGDKQMMQEEAPLQVARCTKIIAGEDGPQPPNAAADGAAAAAPPAGNPQIA